VRLDGFVVAMTAAVAFALLWPEPGTADGPLHLGRLTQLGIALVFFSHGVLLSPRAVRDGAAKWRLHLFVQTCTFVLFPLLGALVYWGTSSVLGEEVRVGFFLLCAMSSTISTSVAMTVMARGDVASAVFNASASNLIGMVLTPLLMLAVTAGQQSTQPLVGTLGGILAMLLVPFALGQLVRPVLLARLEPHKALIGKLDRSVIVLIVYGSFCESTASGVWQRFSLGQLLMTGALALSLLVVMLVLTSAAARRLGFSRAEEITAVFCGSQKSLASGAPLARIMFASHPGLGLIMLPLMVYHQLQLVVCTALAQRYAQRVEASSAA
jgi:sodium/bile acid cotransporter 7